MYAKLTFCHPKDTASLEAVYLTELSYVEEMTERMKELNVLLSKEMTTLEFGAGSKCILILESP